MNNEEYRLFFNKVLKPMFITYRSEVHDVVEDKEANKVSIWCSCSADTVVGPYNNEYILLLYLNEAGDRVRKFVEFVDSEYSASRFAAFSRFLKERKQATTAKANI